MNSSSYMSSYTAAVNERVQKLHETSKQICNAYTEGNKEIIAQRNAAFAQRTLEHAHMIEATKNQSKQDAATAREALNAAEKQLNAEKERKRKIHEEFLEQERQRREDDQQRCERESAREQEMQRMWLQKTRQDFYQQQARADREVQLERRVRAEEMEREKKIHDASVHQHTLRMFQIEQQQYNNLVKKAKVDVERAHAQGIRCVTENIPPTIDLSSSPPKVIPGSVIYRSAAPEPQPSAMRFHSTKHGSRWCTEKGQPDEEPASTGGVGARTLLVRALPVGDARGQKPLVHTVPYIASPGAIMRPQRGSFHLHNAPAAPAAPRVKVAPRAKSVPRRFSFWSMADSALGALGMQLSTDEEHTYTGTEEHAYTDDTGTEEHADTDDI